MEHVKTFYQCIEIEIIRIEKKNVNDRIKKMDVNDSQGTRGGVKTPCWEYSFSYCRLNFHVCPVGEHSWHLSISAFQILKTISFRFLILTFESRYSHSWEGILCDMIPRRPAGKDPDMA